MKIFAMLFMILSLCQPLLGNKVSNSRPSTIVIATKRIYLPTFPGAYNPSLLQTATGYLLTFRYLPNRSNYPWLSHIGIVRLDQSFEPTSPAQLIDTRYINDITPSQSEDARIFSYKGKIYLIYNDNMDLTFPSLWDRRDMYVAELIDTGDQFYAFEPVKLMYKKKYANILWQKNWSPFEWKDTLLLSYSVYPHEVLSTNPETGVCKQFCETQYPIDWIYGTPRGGTPAQLVDGEYLAFFHSSSYTSSPCSDNRELWHYYMGAYAFSAEPPFEMTKFSSSIIDGPGFYTYSSYEKRVIYPGGFVVDRSNLYLAYGKDDSEIWIATINIEALKESMVDVQRD